MNIFLIAALVFVFAFFLGQLCGFMIARKALELDCEHIGSFRTSKAVYSAYKTKDIPIIKSKP